LSIKTYEKIFAIREKVPKFQDPLKEHLFYGMKICNNFQPKICNSRAIFNVEDMIIISKASLSLESIIKGPATDYTTKDSEPPGRDLEWALVSSPPFFNYLSKIFHGEFDLDKVINAKITITGGEIDCS